MKTNLNLQTFFAKRSYYWQKAASTLNDRWFFTRSFTCNRRRVALWCYLLFSLVLSFALPFSFVIAFSLTSFLILPFLFCLHPCLPPRLVSVLAYCVSPYFSFSLRFSVFSSRTSSLVFCTPSGFFCVLSYLAFCFGPINHLQHSRLFFLYFFYHEFHTAINWDLSFERSAVNIIIAFLMDMKHERLDIWNPLTHFYFWCDILDKIKYWNLEDLLCLEKTEYPFMCHK